MKRKFLIVAVIGPDGSGKTLLINYLKKKFNKISLNNERIHLKPSLFKSKITKVSKQCKTTKLQNCKTVKM